MTTLDSAATIVEENGRDLGESFLSQRHGVHGLRGRGER
jgi:hypothetical protein